MKRGLFLKLIFGVYVILIVATYFAADSYVKEKDRREYQKAVDKLDRYFSRQSKFVYATNYHINVAYEQMEIPKFEPRLDITQKKDKEEYDKRWGDVYKAYKLKPRYTSENSLLPDNEWPGWNLHIVEKVSPLSLCEYMVYPYQVVYKKQKDSWNYRYLPSVQEAIDESYNFHINNAQSSYKDYLTNEKIYGLKVADDSDLFSYDNYYFLFSYDQTGDMLKRMADSLRYIITTRKTLSKDISYSLINTSLSSSDDSYFGGMQNSYYKVNNKIQVVGYWDLVYNFWHDPIIKDRNRILIWCDSVLTLLFLFLFVPVYVKEQNKRNYNELSLKEQLLVRCNPKNFMKPYDETKVSKAIVIYDQINATPSDDIDTLKQIRKDASRILGVSFIDQELIKKLLDITNPVKYAEPYDAEKIKVANQLHSRLKADDLDIDDIEVIQKEINDCLV